MPYAQRNWKGEITGLFANAQPGYAEEFLHDDDEGVLAFNTANPIPPEMLRPPTPAEWREREREQERIKAEHVQLQNAILAFNNQFSHLETSLSTLLYEAMHIEPRSSKIPYAVYFSPDGFAARAAIVDNVIKQITQENERLADLEAPWTKVYASVRSIRETRNIIAHGMPITLVIRNKSHVRLTSPPFDPIRVGRHIPKGAIPGITGEKIMKDARKVQWIEDRVSDVNRLLAVFHEAGNPALPEKFAALKAGLLTTTS
jgi:hypothetical protein